MKVAYILPSKANCGPIIVAQELIRQMVINGHECCVYYFDDIGELTFDCKTEVIDFSKRIDFNKFDVIHSHGLRPDMYVFMHKPKVCKAVLVTTLHNYVFEDFKYQYNRLISCVFGNLWLKILKKHDKIVTLSKDAVEYYSKFIDRNKLCFVYNSRSLPDVDESVDVDDETLINEFRKDCILIGVNAALTDRKGVDQIIRVLPELDGYKLMVVGDGKSLNKLKEMAKTLNVSDRVLFLGYRMNAYRYLKFYDIFAIPSRSEGFGLTILEAAIYKKKLLCSDITIFKELLTDKETVYFELDNADSLKNSIRKITSMNDVGNNLFFKYNSDFAPECFYSKYLSIYNDLVSHT